MTPSQPDPIRSLKMFRKRRSLTMLEAATWYGVTESAWSRWEAGKRPVPVPLLRRIKEAT